METNFGISHESICTKNKWRKMRGKILRFVPKNVDANSPPPQADLKNINFMLFVI